MKNILIVDDDPTLLLIIAKWFNSAHPKAGYKILLANNGIEAVKILKEEPIHLLLTDLNMPGMDGFGLLTQMHNLFKNIPIIVMSAFASEIIRKKVEKLGAILFITKPLSFDDFVRIDFENILKPRATTAQNGYIQGITLHSFLQIVNIESKTCSLTINSEGRSGQLFINKGELLSAKTGNLAGNEAALAIMSWKNSALTIKIENSCPDTAKTVDRTIISLLIQAAGRPGLGAAAGKAELK